ncbi:MAG: hypothetical protein U5J97_03435 [Trueperaceae bacterium]|nr:hypothetical protein [Trueperaceae bacterium]
MAAPVALGAVWLWSRRGWGIVIAVVLNVKGAIDAGSLAVGSLASGSLAAGGGAPGRWPRGVFFTVGLARLAGAAAGEHAGWNEAGEALAAGAGRSSGSVTPARPTTVRSSRFWKIHDDLGFPEER